MKQIFLSVSAFFACILPASYGQWTSSNLSSPKAYMGVTSLGSKVYFAGGMNDSGLVSTVEIYDFSTGEWDTTQHLSVARDLVTATTCGNKVLFAGGVDFHSTGNVYATVDIYDADSGTWSVAQLSAARFNITALSHGNRVLFAGGANPQVQAYDNIDIYNADSGTWSVAHLPVPRVAYGGVVGDLGILPGGFDSSGVTKRVDIYNFTTGMWSVDSLSVARAWVAVATLGDKMLIAGGATHDAVQSNVVDIYDAAAGAWDPPATLSFARSFCDNQNTVIACGKAYFLGGGRLNLNGPYWEAGSKRIDIYDLTTNTWTTGVIPASTATVHRAAASVGNQFIIAGGVWGGYFSNAEIYTCQNVGMGSIPENELIVFPNPASGMITVSLPANSPSGHLTVLNPCGEVILQQNIKSPVAEVNIGRLPAGIYFYKFRAGRETCGGKIVKF